jgi:iron complex outermembrane receptor protein
VGGVAASPFAGVTNVLDARYVTAVTVNANGARYFEPGARRALYVGADVSLRQPQQEPMK